MRNAPDAVMIFAAGFGTRMKALTRDKPKPMVKVAGRPLIDHALDLVSDAGIQHCVANVHYKPETLVPHLVSRGVTVSHEQGEILDTGGGLKFARPLLPDGPVFTMNSDAVFSGPNPLLLLTDAWDPATMDALLLLVPVENALGTDSQGDFRIGKSGRLARGVGGVYTGIQILNPDILDEIDSPVFSLNKAWDLLESRGQLAGISYPGKWCDVGHPGGISIAESLLRRADV